MKHFTLFKQSLKHLNLPGNVMRMRANEVDFSKIDSGLLKEVIAGLFYIMYASDGGVGLAAPMVGVSLRIMVADLQDGKPIALINPEVIEQSEEEEEGAEANLCLPEIAAKVKRPKWIKYKAYNHLGELLEEEANGFLARVILHEIEVLNGKMFHDNLPPEKIRYIAPDILAKKSLERIYNETDGSQSQDNNGQIGGDLPQSCSLYLNPITVSTMMLGLKDIVIRKKAAPIIFEEWHPDQLRQLVGDMIWLQHVQEGVGIAAPQVGLSIQMTVIDNRKDPTYVLINPTIVEISDEKELGREGCISLPYQYADVSRSKKIIVDAFDIHGNPTHLEAEGFLAVILQHEIDHLNGVLFPDHLESTDQIEITSPDLKTSQAINFLYPSE